MHNQLVVPGQPPASGRSWPRPRRSWLLAMEWHDLLFAHWPVVPRLLEGLLPRGLRLDTFDGAAWVGVVPFRMASTRPRFTPALPWVGNFPELNVRTYVVAEGKPGVWFFSLDAASPPAVEVARLAFHLPYVHARMACRREHDEIVFTSRRFPWDRRPAALTARYRPTGPAAYAAPGAIEHWLTERYCLYAANRHGRLWRGEVDHVAWPLQPAEAEFAQNGMTAPLGLALQGPPLLHFARHLEVVAWGLEAVAR